jgi:hypothetical protein
MPAANPATAIETSAHRRTRSDDIDPFPTHAAVAVLSRFLAENAPVAVEADQ